MRPLPKISIASITKNFYNGTTAEQLNKAFQTTQHLRREKDRLYSKKIKKVFLTNSTLINYTTNPTTDSFSNRKMNTSLGEMKTYTQRTPNHSQCISQEMLEKIKNNMLLQESDKLLQKTVEYIVNNHFNEYQDFFLNNKTLANTKEKEEEKSFNCKNLLLQCPKHQGIYTKEYYAILNKHLNDITNNINVLDNVLKKDQLTSLEKTLKDLNIVSYNMKDDVSIDKDFEKFLNSDEINNILDIYKGKYLKKLSEIKNINEMKTKKESFYIYTLIINVLSSLFKENNEQASLLYKLFKMYSGKQEQKWLNVINKVKKKEEYYMGLTREILIHKNKEVKNIEEISNLLINQADTKTESERIEMI